MPSLGADMEHGTLLEWRVVVGDHVRRGDIIAVIDTEKSTVEIEVFQTGTVEELLVEPGTEVPVGTPLALITSDGDLPRDDPTPPASPPPARAQTASAEPVAPPPPPTANVVNSPVIRHLAEELGVDTDRIEVSGAGHRVTRDDVERAAALRHGGASPLARRRAGELGVDLAGLVGSGPGGAVRERDVVAAAARKTAPRDPAARQRSVRQAIARLMSTANREIPHYHLASTIDFHAATAWLAENNADLPPARRVLPAALLLRATALAAARHHDLNGHWVDGELRPADGVHLGVAISLRGGGLIAPVIRDADQRSVEETMDRLADLVARSRQGSLRGSEMSGASLTVTNLGTRGAESVFGVIHPPQVALVGFGRIVDRPWVVDGVLDVRPLLTATLSADHRATDGHVGSAFLETIDRLLQDPDRL